MKVNPSAVFQFAPRRLSAGNSTEEKPEQLQAENPVFARSVDLGKLGHDAMGVVGYGNNVQGGFGWDRIGVMGGGNLVNGGFGFDSISAMGPGNACFGGPGFDMVRTLGSMAFGLNPALLLLGCRF